MAATSSIMARRLVAGAVLTAFLFAPTPAMAGAQTLKRSFGNIVQGPIDAVLSPITAGMVQYKNMANIEDSRGVRWFYAVPGYFWLLGLTVAASVLRVVAGALEFLPGLVLLFTDGEDLERRGLAAAEKCREQNLTVHCVGFGSARGSKIALDEGFLTDRSGGEVVSVMDPESLSRVAAATGGVFVDVGARPVLKLYEREIQDKVQKTFDVEGRREHRNRYQWPLLAAFLLWIVHLGYTDRKLS